MALSFDKVQLGNLEYSLQREMLATNRAGGYMSTTIVCCNTRKYHGLMVCPVGQFEDEEFVLLSSLDETIVQHSQSFNLALHKYRGGFSPRGHKYLTDFAYTPTPTMTYRVGGVVLKKELLWIHSAEQLLVRYTLLEARSQTFLHLRPFLAFRSRHSLCRANLQANGRSHYVKGGVRNQPYESLPSLYLQLSREGRFIAAPDWYYDFEYPLEAARGEEAYEDLLTTGYFDIELKAGQSVILSASTTEATPEELDALFEAEIARRSNKIDLLSALEHSARQFLILYQGNTMLQVGYPWYNPRSRETFTALAGCTLGQGLVEQCGDILNYHKGRLHNGLFGKHLAADTQLWFFHTLSEYEKFAGAKAVWNDHGDAIKEILSTYKSGATPDNCIRMAENGLIYASKEGEALTWMNIKLHGTPLTPRAGFAVDVNALWYNAVCYALELATKVGDSDFVKEWEALPAQIEKSFVETFWSEERRHLADYVIDDYHNFEVRPNQLLALSLRYSPLSEVQRGEVLQVVKSHLLTPRGVRTLTPRNLKYKGRYEGDQTQRDAALHQGTAIPWLLEHYVRASFALYGKGFKSEAQDILAGFNEDLTLYGIGSVAEVYDGDPPHRPAGAISSATSLGAMLMINKLIAEQ